MSLKCVLERKLFYQSCCNNHRGVIHPDNVIFGGGQNRSCFIHRTSLFLSSHPGVCLLSISKWNIVSRLTSYFTGKWAEDDKCVKDVSAADVCEGESFQARTQPTGGVTSELPKTNKWLSLVDKLSLSSPYNISTPVTTVLKESLSTENKKKQQHFRQEMLESTVTFLEQYNKDLDLILKKTTSQVSSKKSREKLQNPKTKTKTDDKTDTYKNIKYPFIKICTTVATKTKNFEKTKQLLQSMSISCNELEFYPNIQDMSEETILACVNMLKKKGIHVVFSLFLIDRIYFEIMRLLDRKSESGPKKKKQSQLLPLTSLRQVQLYLELCQLLDTPDLDIRNLLERLADTGQYLDFLTLHKKVKKLIEVGATPKDIMSNLEILNGCEIFDQKIELYKKSPHVHDGPFPVHLFLAKSMNSFKKQLALGVDVDEICKLLGVSIADFQTCWGFKYRNISKLQYKVQMFLSAGISQNDIFNNLRVLVGLSLDECHAVTSSFRTSGLPASIFVLGEVANAANLNRNGNNRCGGDNDHKSVNTCCHGAVDEDWMGEAKTLFPNEAQSILPAKRNQPVSLRKKEISTKKQRKCIFNLIRHLVNLDRAVVSAMYECHINVSSVDVLDIPKNLDYLLSLNFTRHHIAKCPLILANSHTSLLKVVLEAENLILMQLRSTSSSPPLLSWPGLFEPLPGSLSSPSLLMSSSYHTNAKDQLSCSLFASPLQRLNIYQYFLEKENNFSLASVDCGRMSDFLNV